MSDLISTNESGMSYDSFRKNFEIESLIFRANERGKKIKIISGVEHSECKERLMSDSLDVFKPYLDDLAYGVEKEQEENEAAK